MNIKKIVISNIQTRIIDARTPIEVDYVYSGQTQVDYKLVIGRTCFDGEIILSDELNNKLIELYDLISKEIENRLS